MSHTDYTNRFAIDPRTAAGFNTAQLRENFLLPPLLKKVSVIHYLNSLLPVPLNEGPFAVVAEPTPAWIAIPSMLLVTLLVLVLAGYRIRKMEIRYGGE